MIEISQFRVSDHKNSTHYTQWKNLPRWLHWPYHHVCQNQKTWFMQTLPSNVVKWTPTSTSLTFVW